MPVHDALDCCKSDACSGKFRQAVQSLEGLEQTSGLRLVEPCSVIANEVDSSFRIPSEFNSSGGMRGRVLP
jgi:hypothetical protein